jgi:hypothetical protein
MHWGQCSNSIQSFHLWQLFNFLISRVKVFNQFLQAEQLVSTKLISLVLNHSLLSANLPFILGHRVLIGLRNLKSNFNYQNARLNNVNNLSKRPFVKQQFILNHLVPPYFIIKSLQFEFRPPLGYRQSPDVNHLFLLMSLFKVEKFVNEIISAQNQTSGVFMCLYRCSPLLLLTD